MGDRAPADITILACPPELAGEILAFLDEWGFGDDWGSGLSSNNSITLGHTYCNDEASLGVEMSLPDAEGLAFTYHQDAKYEYNAVSILKLPDGRAVEFEGDQQGRAMVSADQIDEAIAGSNTMGDLIDRLNVLTGARERMGLERLENQIEAMPEADRVLVVPEEDDADG